MSFRLKYDAFMSKHPKIKKTKENVAMLGYATGAVGAVFTGILVLAFVAGSVNMAWTNRKKKTVLRPDDRKATLIEKKDNLLFLDIDGNTNTAEVIVRTEMRCPTTIEAVRQAQVGSARKVSEWKGCMVDNCWENHFEWIDMTTKERENI